MVIPTRYSSLAKPIRIIQLGPKTAEASNTEEHPLTFNLNQEIAMSKNSGSPKPMTQTDASRIQGAEARAKGGKVESGSFPARAQGAAARNATPKK